MPSEIVPIGSAPPQEPPLVEQDPDNPRKVYLQTIVQKQFMRVTQSDNIKNAEHLMTPLVRIISRFSTAQTTAESLMIALEMLDKLSPQDPVQHMLAHQMIAVHFAALGNLITARAEDNTMEQAEHYTNRATRLMRLSAT